MEVVSQGREALCVAAGAEEARHLGGESDQNTTARAKHLRATLGHVINGILRRL